MAASMPNDAFIFTKPYSSGFIETAYHLPENEIQTLHFREDLAKAKTPHAVEKAIRYNGLKENDVVYQGLVRHAVMIFNSGRQLQDAFSYQDGYLRPYQSNAYQFCSLHFDLDMGSLSRHFRPNKMKYLLCGIGTANPWEKDFNNVTQEELNQEMRMTFFVKNSELVNKLRNIKPVSENNPIYAAAYDARNKNGIAYPWID